MVLNSTEAATTFSHGNPTTPQYALPTGIGSTLGTIAANVAWIWSALKLRMNINGSSKELEVSYTTVAASADTVQVSLCAWEHSPLGHAVSPVQTNKQ